MKQSHFVRMAAAFALFFLSVGNLWAQAPQRGPWSFTLEGGGVNQSSADLKDSDGSFGVDRWFVSAGVDYSWSFRDGIGVSIGAGQNNYDFDPGDAANLPTYAEPWDKVSDQRLSVSGRFGFGETGTMLIIPTVRYNAESGASSSDSRIYGVLAAAFWRINPDLTIGPGIGAFSRLEDSARVFPILAIDWNINERWNLSTGRGLAASQGPGLTLSYKFSPVWSLGLSGRYEDQEFRLAEDGPVPGGVGRDRSFPLVLSGRFDPNPMMSFSAFAGAELAGTLEVQDPDGVELESSDYDPAALIGVTFEFKF